MRTIVMFCLTVGLALGVGQGCQTGAPDTLSAEDAAAARRTVMAWLECVECTDGELEKLVSLGPTAVPSLEAALAKGPSPARRALLARDLASSHRDMVEYRRSHDEAPLQVGEQEFVDTHLAKEVRSYQTRAILGLAAIDDAAARRALREAASLPLDAGSRTLLAQVLANAEAGSSE